MPGAVERIRIRHWHAGRVVRVVRIAHQVRAAFHLGCVGAEQCRIGGFGAVREGGVPGSHRAGPAKVRVRVVDARVNDRDADVLAMQPRRALPRLGRADERHALRVDEVIDPNAFDFHDARQRGEPTDLLGRAAHLDAVDRVLELPLHGSAHPLNGRHDRVLATTQVALDRLSLCLGELLARRAAAHYGDRIAGHFEYDGLWLLRERTARNHGSGDALQFGPAARLCGRRDRYQGDERKCGKAAADESKGSRWSSHVRVSSPCIVTRNGGSLILSRTPVTDFRSR